MEKILEVFKQVKVNISLLDTFEQVAFYAKFFKDLCTKKRATSVPKKLYLAFNISKILSNSMPMKYKKYGHHTMSCTIENIFVDKCLADLRASVNLLLTLFANN